MYTMKQTLFFLIAAALLAFMPAQDLQAQGSLAVKSFRLLQHDTTANSAGTSKIDQNGEVCALIKVVTTETGFTFDIGSLGVTDTKQDVGEIWVYVPRGAKRITIKHPRLGVLRDYYFNMPIQGGLTYELVLISGTVKTNETDRASLAKIMGCSEPTVTRRFKDPGSLTLDELTALGRGLHIPIDDLRAAIRY